MVSQTFRTLKPHPLERVPPGESELIEQVVALQLELMRTRQDPAKRGQHPKHQALLRGTFEIADRVPADMAVGVFARKRRFDALVRLSTGPMPRDCDPNPHGLAIKLLDVAEAPDGTQDVITLDQPTFFIRDMADYVRVFQAMRAEPGGSAFYRDRPTEFALNLAFNVVIGSQLERQYWSEVPIAMGAGAVRLTLMPAVENVSYRPPATTADGLKDALVAHLVTERRSARFLVAAQRYVDDRVTPIEDAMSVWPTPFEPLATLTLPAQDFTAPEQYALGEALAFTPWHCVEAHQPLGGIQRCRLHVYEASAQLRRERTGVADDEPTAADLDRLGPLL